ncbi:phage head-tail joining protein [Undibacterium squillarum]|uniref:GpW protein n=1 Tax=Undibacterium squillarum TaxID=1131567 RepID=A0ABQ2Y322_9BURK|nr:hypothetical protein [Undibacterium squillarum]GGX53050.1 hypothetical protein GCM10010946_34550 [Undibacterium squillarum]
MAYTGADLDALDTAIKSGVKKVKHNGREVEYHSVDEMLRLRDRIAAELLKGSSAERTRVTRLRFNR